MVMDKFEGQLLVHNQRSTKLRQLLAPVDKEPVRKWVCGISREYPGKRT